MTPEIEAYWRRTFEGLIDAIGPDDARYVIREVQRRIGDGGTSRQYTVALLKVLTEWSRERGYTGSVAAIANALATLERKRG